MLESKLPKVIGGLHLRTDQVLLAGALGVALATASCTNRIEGKHLPLIAITQIATHPALDEVRAGLIAGLKKRGFSDGKTVTIVFKNANGDASLTLPIAQELVRLSPAVIVPISTPSTLSIAKSTTTLPVVFSGVTDPVGTGLVANLEHPGGNITGVSDRWPFEAQVAAFQLAFPKAHRIGMLYTRGDDVSKIGVDAMTSLSKKRGFELRLVPVSEGSDVYPAAVSLLKDVDAIYTGIDHLLLENLDGLVKAAREARKPLFGGESGSVEKGGVLALSINMTDFGDLTAELVAKVLGGQKPGDIPIAVVSNGDLLVNKEVAIRFGIDLPALQRDGAKFIDGK
jgi:putative tryptophan/tyrosine transport system substrate-binding protein